MYFVSNHRNSRKTPLDCENGPRNKSQIGNPKILRHERPNFASLSIHWKVKNTAGPVSLVHSYEYLKSKKLQDFLDIQKGIHKSHWMPKYTKPATTGVIIIY